MNPVSSAESVLNRRRAGVLLHPGSLSPEPRGGCFGPEARRFTEFLAHCGFSVWQMLPLGPTHDDGSPYQSLSVHAGNPDFVSLQWLHDRKLLSAKEFADQGLTRSDLIALAWDRLADESQAPLRQQYHDFRLGHDLWLYDYALFVLLRNDYAHQCWNQWPAEYRDRDPDTLLRLRDVRARELELICFEQFLFYEQWHELRAFANRHGVLLFGDVPIFVSYDSADVWAHRDQFALDEQGEMAVVAGVPPDYFSETGQRWGNPHYRWDRMQVDDFRWWHERIAAQLELFDLVRIDHFRGFEACWEIPAHEETAINGHWVQVPGRPLFDSLRERYGVLPFVAEDLGVITEEVTRLRRDYGLPGMKILQFAFDGSADNPYLPHNHEPDSVVYTGTHDNDTVVGWFDSLGAAQRQQVADYLCCAIADIPWVMISTALASVARLAVVPMQDLLQLDGRYRMNTPGTTEGNWGWRLDWDDIPADLPGRLRRSLARYGR